MPNQQTQKNIAVIGAGPMGLMATHELLKKGFKVTLFERDDRIGGMSASFDFDGTQIERFYHFICKPDQPTFDLLKEFNLLDKLKWRDTSMGFYCHGKLYKWGTPGSLLTFPKINLITKLRYGLMALYTCRIKNWTKLDKVGVTAWLKKWVGQKGYDVLWHNLFHYKFYEYKNDLSAAWLGTRIKRVGLSRRNMFQEELGYLEGGSAILLDKMEHRINKLGGRIKLTANVTEITTKDNKIQGVNVDGKVEHFDAVVSTIPLPYISQLAPDLSADTRKKIDSIANVGVACVLFKSKRPLTKHFWLNINDKRIEIPGIIEYSNLNPGNNPDENILYVPYYMPNTHPKYKWSDQQFVDEAKKYLSMVSADFNSNDILATKVTRYAFSQTVCGTNFYQQLPPMRSTDIQGFYMADTAYYYPEDRSISESVEVGRQLAELVNEDCA